MTGTQLLGVVLVALICALMVYAVIWAQKVLKKDLDKTRARFRADAEAEEFSALRLAEDYELEARKLRLKAEAMRTRLETLTADS